MSSVSSRPQAPEFPDGKSWLNVNRPVRLADVRGRVVLLHFWSYASIECLSILDKLVALRSKYRRQVVVIGVHCPKYPAQRDERNLRNAALQYGVTYPLLNDAGFETWKLYSVRDWATFVLIDRKGRIASYFSGRESLRLIDHQLARLVHETKPQGPESNGFRTRRQRPRLGLLHFPTQLLADPESDRLFIADTGHNRILVCDLSGRWLDTIGRGAVSRSDGTFEQTTFNRPRGLALDSGHLYVADTGNHLLRRCNLEKRIVSTVAGTGEQELRAGSVNPGKPLLTSLSSPWALLRLEKTLFITMPGLHQIWVFDLLTQEIGSYAGTAFPGRIDGPGHMAAFAKPTAIAWDGNRIYVADSEGNAVRQFSFEPNPIVSTALGVGPFDFGDADGTPEHARLQHPEGLAFGANRLFIADSYNHKIKTFDRRGSGREPVSETCFGSGTAGFRDGAKPLFYEPNGLAYACGRLYVADTNNHVIRVAHLDSGETRTLRIA